MGIRIEYKQGDVIGHNGCTFIKDVELINGIKPRSRKAEFKCGRCGSEFVAIISAVKFNNNIGCGCSHDSIIYRGINKTHGFSNHALYHKWSDIKSRCLCKTNGDYKFYGGRDVDITKEWVHDFINFYNYVMSLPHAMEDGHSIDRINTDGNYEPGNVRWATRETQARNRRPRRGKYNGIFKNKKSGSWICSIGVDGKKVYLGTFKCEYEALLVRNKYILDHNLCDYDIQKIID